MKYLQPTFTLPTSQGISQEDWDKIFNPETTESKFTSTGDRSQDSFYADNDGA